MAEYAVPELAEALGVSPAAARARLRSREISVPYKWDSKEKFQKVVDKLTKEPPSASRSAKTPVTRGVAKGSKKRRKEKAEDNAGAEA